MTNTPAMPELPSETVIAIGKKHFPKTTLSNAWFGFAADIALATLQAQPAAKCDGNHGGPRCADPECWNDDPQAQPAAEVSDDDLQAIDDAHNWQTLKGRMAAYRAILALRPQAVPMTDEQAKQFLKRSALLDMFLHIGWYSAPRKGFDENALSLIRAVEAHHGITTPAGGEGKA